MLGWRGLPTPVSLIHFETGDVLSRLRVFQYNRPGRKNYRYTPHQQLRKMVAVSPLPIPAFRLLIIGGVSRLTIYLPQYGE
jgi:hypothetical protein